MKFYCIKNFVLFIALLFFLPDIVNTQTTNINVMISPDKARFIVIDSVISNLSKKELRELCKKLDISTEGSKNQLIMRLRHFLQLDKKEEKEKKKQKEDLKDVIIIESADEGEYLQLEDTEQEILTASGNVHLVYNKIRLKYSKWYIYFMSIAKQVRIFIKNKPYIQESLEKGIVNLSSLSRKIQEELDIENFEAVKAALRRLSEELQKTKHKREERVLQILKKNPKNRKESQKRKDC